MSDRPISTDAGTRGDTIDAKAERGLGRERPNDIGIQLFYVQDTRQYVGNCMLFWAKDRKGYTCELDNSGLYTQAEVDRMRETDRPWPREIIEQNAIRHVRGDNANLVEYRLAGNCR